MMHKLGIIGYGGMAHWHAGNAPKTGCIEATAVFDIDPERVEDAVKNGMAGFDNLDDFLASKLFDIVLIATPNNFHRDYAVAAMRAGYNVISEKPVAMNLAELEDMIAVSEETGKLFTVHHNRRWDSDYNVVCKALKAGMVGKPYTIESCVHGSGGVVHGWRAYKVAGGGMLFDWGIHTLDQILCLLEGDKVIDVSCHMESVRTPEVDDYFKLILEFESGVNVQLEVGTYCLKGKPRWYINGTEGSLIVNDWDLTGGVIHSSQTGIDWEPVVVQTKAGPTRTMAPRPKETLEELPLPEVDEDCKWESFYQNVCATLDGEAELIVRPEQLRRSMKVVEAAFKSAETHHSVQVDI